MSVETVNGYVLLPVHANRIEDISWKRSWNNEIADAEFGHESRYSLRRAPRVSQSWKVTAIELTKNAELSDRIMAAKKSGKACAPYFGRGCQLASPVTGSAVVLKTGTLWPWAIGQKAFFIDYGDRYDVRQVATVFDINLTLTAAVSRPYTDFMWPMIFGRFSCDDLSLATEECGEINLTIDELTSPQATIVGTAGPPIDGIGGWIIEDTFIVQ